MDFLYDRTILLTLAGSHAYGTNTPSSDLDIKGVCIPPAVYREGFLHRFEQTEGANLGVFVKTLTSEEQSVVAQSKIDGTVYALAKFMGLAANCNPSMLDLLFCDGTSVRKITRLGQVLRDNRDMFLSKKAVGAFSGYAHQQLARIKTHRRWLLEPPKAPPERSDFGLKPVGPGNDLNTDQRLAAMALVQKKIDSWAIDFEDLSEASKIYIFEQIRNYLEDLTIGSSEKFMAAGRLIGFQENFLEILDKERKYKAAVDNWQSYQTWKSERNAARAELEAKYGFDTKHAMHLVRLMRMCREILAEGVVRVKRPDAEELLAIRGGAWTYDQLMEWATRQDQELVEVARTTTLRKHADLKALDRLCRELTKLAEDGWDGWEP